MVGRPVPISEIVTGSTPVVAFGDPRAAIVATLGINPSWREFLSDDGSLLCGPKRRLATLGSLHAESTVSLRPDQIRSAIEEVRGVFSARTQSLPPLVRSARRNPAGRP